MIYFFTPYSFKKKLFQAIDQYMSLLKDDDWAVLLDGDTMFLTPDFGHQIQDYINDHPDTGMFTCYASRCHYAFQKRKGTQENNPDLIYHKKWAKQIHNELHGVVKNVDRRVAGHLMVIKKSTWNKIRSEVSNKAKDKNILGVDTKISNAILKHGLKILLMRGMYLLHYCRLAEGYEYKSHIE